MTCKHNHYGICNVHTVLSVARKSLEWSIYMTIISVTVCMHGRQLYHKICSVCKTGNFKWHLKVTTIAHVPRQSVQHFWC